MFSVFCGIELPVEWLNGFTESHVEQKNSFFWEGKGQNRRIGLYIHFASIVGCKSSVRLKIYVIKNVVVQFHWFCFSQPIFFFRPNTKWGVILKGSMDNWFFSLRFIVMNLRFHKNPLFLLELPLSVWKKTDKWNTFFYFLLLQVCLQNLSRKSLLSYLDLQNLVSKSHSTETVSKFPNVSSIRLLQIPLRSLFFAATGYDIDVKPCFVSNKRSAFNCHQVPWWISEKKHFTYVLCGCHTKRKGEQENLGNHSNQLSSRSLFV